MNETKINYRYVVFVVARLTQIAYRSKNEIRSLALGTFGGLFTIQKFCSEIFSYGYSLHSLHSHQFTLHMLFFLGQWEKAWGKTLHPERAANHMQNITSTNN